MGVQIGLGELAWTGEHQLGLDDAKWWDGDWRLQAASAEIERRTRKQQPSRIRALPGLPEMAYRH